MCLYEKKNSLVSVVVCIVVERAMKDVVGFVGLLYILCWNNQRIHWFRLYFVCYWIK